MARSDYAKAVKAEREELKKGQYHKGIKG